MKQANGKESIMYQKVIQLSVSQAQTIKLLLKSKVDWSVFPSQTRRVCRFEACLVKFVFDSNPILQSTLLKVYLLTDAKRSK